MAGVDAQTAEGSIYSFRSSEIPIACHAGHDAHDGPAGVTYLLLFIDSHAFEGASTFLPSFSLLEADFKCALHISSAVDCCSSF